MKIFEGKIKKNQGMTYVELIVVLGIFAVLSSVAIFNYGGFQARVDIKNLASDIALQIVQAQKTALSGTLPPSPFIPGQIWKPAYGVYFNLTGTENKSFIYFVDINNSTAYDGLSACTSECLNKVSITKGNWISAINIYYTGNATPASVTNLTATFSRPDSGAVITSTPALLPNVSYAQITVLSPNGATSLIKLYSSGRIQVN